MLLGDFPELDAIDENDTNLDKDNNEQKKETEDNSEQLQEPVTERAPSAPKNKDISETLEIDNSDAVQNARISAIIEAVGTNPYTNEAIEDSADVAEYLAMKAISKEGGDPVQDYYKYQKKQLKAKVLAETSHKTEEDWLKNDAKAFYTTHPEVNRQQLFGDVKFQKYAEHLIGKMPMSNIYDNYNEFVSSVKNDTTAKVTDALARNLANNEASPGALNGTNETGNAGFYSKEQIQRMSEKEIDANWEKVQASLKKF